MIFLQPYVKTIIITIHFNDTWYETILGKRRYLESFLIPPPWLLFGHSFLANSLWITSSYFRCRERSRCWGLQIVNRNRCWGVQSITCWTYCWCCCGCLSTISRIGSIWLAALAAGASTTIRLAALASATIRLARLSGSTGVKYYLTWSRFTIAT